MVKVILSGCLILNDQEEILLLYRPQHKHFETPGGKVDLHDANDPENPTRRELRHAAGREAHEELGDIVLGKLEYVGNVEFTIPDGREAIAHKFKTWIKIGEPRVNEPDVFSALAWIPLARLKEYKLSLDLQLFEKVGLLTNPPQK